MTANGFGDQFGREYLTAPLSVATVCKELNINIPSKVDWNLGVGLPNKASWISADEAGPESR